MKNFLKKTALVLASLLFLCVTVGASYFLVSSVLNGFSESSRHPAAATGTSPSSSQVQAATPQSPESQPATPYDPISELESQILIDEKSSSRDEVNFITTEEVMYTVKDTLLYKEQSAESDIIGKIPAGTEVLAIRYYPDDDSWDDAASEAGNTSHEASSDAAAEESDFVNVIFGELSGYAYSSQLSYEMPNNIPESSSAVSSKPASSKPESSSSTESSSSSRASSNTSSSSSSSTASSSSSTSSGSSSGSSIASLINSAKLNPTKTGCAPLDKMVQNVLNKCTNSSMTTYDKVKAVYDYIIKNTSYAYSFIDDNAFYSSTPVYIGSNDYYVVREAYALLKNGVGVCDNYAGAFTVITRAIGLESYFVTGQVETYDGGYTGHAWNNIKLGNTYYIFDAQVEDNDYDRNGSIRYIYFCKKDSQLSGVYKYYNRDADVKNFSNFTVAPTLTSKIKVSLADDAFTTTYSAAKSYSEYTDKSFEYTGSSQPKASVTFNITKGTAPYTVQLAVTKYTTGISSVVYDKSMDISTNKQTLSYVLPDSGEYTVMYSVTDATGQCISVKTFAYCISSLPISDVKIECSHFEDNDYIIAMSYKNGGNPSDITAVFKVVDTATGKEIESTSITAQFSYIYPLTSGHTYSITIDVTDAYGNEVHVEKKYKAKK